MLHLRKRGEVYHARGTVRIAAQKIPVAEFSTGCRSRADAEEVAHAEEARIRKEHLEGDSGRKSRLTLAECFLAYLQRPNPPKDYDKVRIGAFSAKIGAYTLPRLNEAWTAWLASRAGVAPATLARERGILQAAVNYGCAALNALPAPRVAAVRQVKGTRLVYLTDEYRKALLAAYSPAARRVVTMLAYQGCRSREATQLKWQDVSMEMQTIRFIDGETKTGHGRTVPMHPEVYAMLAGMHEAASASRQGKAPRGHVFLSSRGQPYQDTRGKGGNPLAQAHETACAKVGVTGFRLHDWRHDYSSRAVMSGMDVVTLCRLVGWKDMRMAQRYLDMIVPEYLVQSTRKIA